MEKKKSLIEPNLDRWVTQIKYGIDVYQAYIVSGEIKPRYGKYRLRTQQSKGN